MRGREASPAAWAFICVQGCQTAEVLRASQSALLMKSTEEPEDVQGRLSPAAGRLAYNRRPSPRRMRLMLIVLSPAKSLDFTTPAGIRRHTQPRFLDEAEQLVGLLRELSLAEVAELMDLSDQLAALNVVRYGEWRRPFTAKNAKQALLAFNGDVYAGLQAATLGGDDLAWAQARVRMLSGLYGVLRPLDLMQPYRLEMGTRLANPRGRDLYTSGGNGQVVR